MLLLTEHKAKGQIEWRKQKCPASKHQHLTPSKTHNYVNQYDFGEKRAGGSNDLKYLLLIILTSLTVVNRWGNLSAGYFLFVFHPPPPAIVSIPFPTLLGTQGYPYRFHRPGSLASGLQLTLANGKHQQEIRKREEKERHLGNSSLCSPYFSITFVAGAEHSCLHACSSHWALVTWSQAYRWQWLPTGSGFWVTLHASDGQPDPQDLL